MNHPLVERARTEGTPLIDPVANTTGDAADTRVATFVWAGKRAPRLIGDFCGWEDGDPVVLVKEAPSVWTYRLALPKDAYMEYVFVDGDQRLDDPFNLRRVSNGMGKYNQYFYVTPGRQPPALPRRLKGQVERHVIEAEHLMAGLRRNVYLYRPATEQPVPLVVVWDGRDYLRRARLDVIVDTLISQGRICPLALAMVDNGRQARTLEYACSEATLGLLYEAVLPLARQHLNLVDVSEQPGAYGVLGASMGGLMALYTGLRMAGIFGHVLSQSGAFTLDDYDSVVFELVEHGPRRDLKVWLDVGLYDLHPLLPSNRRMRAALAARGYGVGYNEYPAGHNYNAWREDVVKGLEFLYG